MSRSLVTSNITANSKNSSDCLNRQAHLNFKILVLDYHDLHVS